MFTFIFGTVLGVAVLACSLKVKEVLDKNWYSQVRIGTYTCTAISHDDLPQEANKVLPDTKEVLLEVVVALPQGGKFRPTDVCAALSNPGGQQIHVLKESITASSGPRKTLLFRFPGERFWAKPGLYHITQSIQGIEQAADHIELIVPRCKSLLEDLKVKKTSLRVAIDGPGEECVNVCTAFTTVILAALLKSSAHPASKYKFSVLKARLVNLDTGVYLPPIDVPIQISNGDLHVVCSCSPVLNEIGNWELSLLANDRILCQRSFRVISPEELIEVVEPTLLGMDYEDHGGRTHPLERSIVSSYTRCINFHFGLRSEHSSRLIPYPVTCAIQRGTDECTEMRLEYRLEDGECLVQRFSFAIPTMDADADPEEWKITFSLPNRVLLQETITVRAALPKDALLNIQFLDKDRPPQLEALGRNKLSAMDSKKRTRSNAKKKSTKKNA